MIFLLSILTMESSKAGKFALGNSDLKTDSSAKIILNGVLSIKLSNTKSKRINQTNKKTKATSENKKKSFNEKTAVGKQIKHEVKEQIIKLFRVPRDYKVFKKLPRKTMLC